MGDFLQKGKKLKTQESRVRLHDSRKNLRFSAIFIIIGSRKKSFLHKNVTLMMFWSHITKMVQFYLKLKLFVLKLVIFLGKKQISAKLQ